MKKSISCSMMAFGLLILVFSCKKDHARKVETQTINVTVNMNDEYSLDLGGFGDEEDASISRQAMHCQISSLTRENYATCTYHYTSALNYIGTDEVELKSARGSDGGSPNDKILLTTIRFTIVTR